MSTGGAETAAQGDLSAAIADRFWYHSIEVAPGVVTPGWMDTRRVAQDIGLPDSLAGKRCLDIGTFDGFWAYEMERRGAAEVHAIDILEPSGWDWPASAPEEAISGLGAQKDQGVGFDIAHEALGSSVIRHERSVYDLDPPSTVSSTSSTSAACCCICATRSARSAPCARCAAARSSSSTPSIRC